MTQINLQSVGCALPKYTTTRAILTGPQVWGGKVLSYWPYLGRGLHVHLAHPPEVLQRQVLGVLSKKEVRLWQLHVQCAVKPPHCTSQLFRRKPLFCVETKEPFFSAHKFFCRRGTSQYFQAVAQSTTSLAPLYLVHYDTHFTILWLDAGLFWRNLYRTKVEVNNAIMTTNENHDQPFLF